MSEKNFSHYDLQPWVKASAQLQADAHRTTTMNKMRLRAFAAALLGLGASMAFAADDAPTTGARQMSHEMIMPEATVDEEIPDAAPDKSMMMNQGDMKMNMQGGSAPSDARDPHAYSGGLSIDSGEYSLPDTPRISFTDEYTFVGLTIDRLEAIKTRGDSSNGGAYEGMLRIGRDYNALVIKAEGDVADGKLEEASTEALYSHAVATYWDAQLGARYDSGVGPNRGWLALGMQGLAPYWFEIDVTAYIGNQERTAFRLSTEYDLLITQRLVLQPSLEVNFYGKDDTQRDIGSGLSNTSAALLMRYEFSRQIAPYIGIEGVNSFGRTADFLRADGTPTRNTRYVAGLRFWF